jgi:ribosomal subunit interface protein
VNLEITARNYEISRRVRTTAEERADKFTRYVSELQNVRFTLTQERVDNICDIHLHAHGKDFHAKISSDDMLSSVEKAASSMDQQLRRYKTKRADRRRRVEPSIPSPDVGLVDELDSAHIPPDEE